MSAAYLTVEVNGKRTRTYGGNQSDIRDEFNMLKDGLITTSLAAVREDDCVEVCWIKTRSGKIMDSFTFLSVMDYYDFLRRKK